MYHADHACVRTFQVNNISYTSFNLYEATKNDKTCFYLCTTLSLCKPTQKLFAWCYFFLSSAILMLYTNLIRKIKSLRIASIVKQKINEKVTACIKVNMLIERSSYDKFVMRHDTFQKLNRAFWFKIKIYVSIICYLVIYYYGHHLLLLLFVIWYIGH